MVSQQHEEIKGKYKQAGLLPGSLVYVGRQKVSKNSIKVFNYSKTRFKEYEMDKVDAHSLIKKESTVTWINVCGVNNPEIMKALGKYFNLHDLLLEDIMDTHHRPKIEHLEDHTFIILKSLTYNTDKAQIDSEQISLIFGKNFLISFQENDADLFEIIEKRLRDNRGIVRGQRSDYLAYTLIDLIVDNYFTVLEKVEDKTELIEKRLIANPTPKILSEINKLKKENMYLYKFIWPLRDVVSNLAVFKSKFVHHSTLRYLSDVQDHVMRALDIVENFKNMTKGMTDIYLSSVNNKMNEIIKILTIVTSIFIPLTFITGIYGMNFTNMPEIQWEYGYFVALGLMVAVTVFMIIFFIKRKWL